ncbi:unnamed protein product [Absidia cylindrospora]
MASLSNFLPPSPTNLSSPPSRKGSNLQIDTKDSPNDITADNGFWKAQSSLFSPPLSPLTPLYIDRPLQSSTTRKKTQQQQQQQQIQQQQQQQLQGPVPWQTNWKDVDIETLTLENAKLQRANRLLKVDREDWLEKRLKPLNQHIRELTVTNVRWQRAAKLLQQDVEEAQQQLADWKHYQVTRIPQMDPEYQFLVNMIYHLQSQINGRTTCKETNGNTMKSRSINHTDSQEMPEEISRKASHSACNTVSNWDELSLLVDKIHILEQNLDTTLKQLSQKNHALAQLESELQNKNQLMTRLEKDFDEMNDQLQSWQHVIESGMKYPSSHEMVAPTNMATLEMQPETKDRRDTASNSDMDDEGFIRQDSDDMDASDDDDILGSDQSLLTDNAESTSIEGYQDQEDKFDKLACDLPTTTKTTFVSPPLTHHLRASHANTTPTTKAHWRASSSVYSSSSTTTIACCEDDDKSNQRCITYSSSLSQDSINESSSIASSPTSPTSPSSSSSSSLPASSISEQHSISPRHSSYPLAAAQFTHQFPSVFTMDPNSTVLLPGSYPTTGNLSTDRTSSTTSLYSVSSDLSSTDVSTMEAQNIHWSGSNDGDQQERTTTLRTLVMGHEPFAPFALMSLFLGLSTKMGINEDWLIPITLLALFSGYLWRGAFCGIRIKVNI